VLRRADPARLAQLDQAAECLEAAARSEPRRS
jgi:hypothetical protein